MSTQYLDTWSRERNAGKVSAWERLRAGFASGRFARNDKAERTLVSGLDARKLALLVDVSHWQGDINLATIVNQGDVAMCLPT